MATLVANLDITRYVKVSTGLAALLLQSHRDTVRIAFSVTQPSLSNTAFHEIGGLDHKGVLSVPATGTPIWVLATTNRAKLSITELGATEVHMANGTQLDAFGRLRVSEPTTLFDAQQEYGLETVDTWDLAANSVYGDSLGSNVSVSDAGSSVGPTDATSGMTPITAAAVDGARAVLQSRQFVRYIPGKSQFIAITGVFANSADDTASIVLASSTGTEAIREVQQANWSVDKFDGTGPSGITIDFTKTQILTIDAQALYSGRVRVGFEIDGIHYTAHEYLNANNQSFPFIRTFNLPVRADAITDVTGTDIRVGYFVPDNGVYLKLRTPTQGGTTNLICCSVQSEGGKPVSGFPRGISTRITLRTVPATGLPVLSIRSKATFNGKVNRAHVDLSEFAIFVEGVNPVYYEVIEGGTINGTWVSVDDNSVVEYNVTATTIPTGVALREGYAAGGGTGSGSSLTGGEASLRSPLVLSKIDDLVARQLPFTIMAYGIGGNANAGAAINWNEQTI